MVYMKNTTDGQNRSSDGSGCIFIKSSKQYKSNSM